MRPLPANRGSRLVSLVPGGWPRVSAPAPGGEMTCNGHWCALRLGWFSHEDVSTTRTGIGEASMNSHCHIRVSINGDYMFQHNLSFMLATRTCGVMARRDSPMLGEWRRTGTSGQRGTVKVGEDGEGW